MTHSFPTSELLPIGDDGLQRHGVFVPAVMSVGVLFSIATLLRDAFHWVGGNSLERRTALNAGATVSWLLDDPPRDPDDLGMLPRNAYLVSALLFVGGSLYVAIGSIANFLRAGGYVRDIAWLLGLSLGLSIVLVFLGFVALVTFWYWPHPPSWTYDGLRVGPFTTAYHSASDSGPSWAVTTGLITTAVATGLVILMVGTGRSIALEIDQPITDWLAELASLDRLSSIDAFGATWIAVLLAGFAGLAAIRCRVLAWVYPIAVVAGLFTTAMVREVIERSRPSGIGVGESFPSGHAVQAVLIAGLVPLAAWVLTGDHRSAAVSRVALALAVVVTVLHRIHVLAHWPLDAVAGIGVGMTIVLGAYWAVEHSAWHHRCRGCPWGEAPAPPIWSKLLIHMSDETARRVGWLGSFAAMLAAIGLLIATFVVGVPTDPEGYGLTSQLAQPVQVALATLVLLAGVAAFHWKASAAVTMALAGTLLGIFAAVQYQPWAAVALVGMLLVPAVLTWVSWQKDETVGRITALAAVTAGLVVSAWVGANQVHAAFFGPTHPESGVVLDDLEEAAWVWVGGVTTNEATIVAGGLETETTVSLSIVDSVGSEERVDLPTGLNGIVRHTWETLAPGTEYRYVIGEDPRDIPDSFDGSFATFAAGPQDLTVVFGSCARTASNGSVFDAMAAAEPDLYVGVGDLHYSNLASTAPSDHIDEYHRLLTQPAQAQLFRSTPFAYVWDDHDFGPNDADASSPSRLAVSLAYRRAVPDYGVNPDPDESIAQAFTIGRVRFVLIDTRSMRTEDTMLGDAQLSWLIDELVESSKNHALVVWVNPTPWVASSDGVGADDWSAYPQERRMIADAIADASVENLVMVSGDAHMVAVDDGTNTDFSTSGSNGFPLLHAAALDRSGSVKGGPYSEGAFPGGGQFGMIEVGDDGGSIISVTMSGHTWDGETLVSLSWKIEVDDS